MSERPKRVTLPPESVVAKAIREGARDIAQAITEALGPRVELRQDDEVKAAEALRDTLERLREPGEVVPLVVEATSEEMDDPRLLEAVIRKQHLTFYETDGQKMKRLLAEMRARALILSGYREQDDPTAGDVAQNELATERADTVMAFFDLAQGHPLPRKLLPRGDQVLDWLPPGMPVTVMGRHGAVAPKADTVRVQLEGWPAPVEFPRANVEEGHK